MTKHPTLWLPGPSSFFLILILGQNPIRNYLLYVRTSSKAITDRLLLLLGRSKGGMRFLNAVTMETDGRVIATLVTATPETHTTYQVTPVSLSPGSCSFSPSVSLLHCLTLNQVLGYYCPVYGISHNARGQRRKERVRLMKPPAASSFPGRAIGHRVSNCR